MAITATFEVHVAQDCGHVWSTATFAFAPDTSELHVSIDGVANCDHRFPLAEGCSLDALSNRTYLLRHRSFPHQVLFRSPRQAATALDEFMMALRAVLTTPYWSLARRQVEVLVQTTAEARGGGDVDDDDLWEVRQLVLWGKSLSVFRNHECLHVYNTNQGTVEPIHHLSFRWVGSPTFTFRSPDAIHRCRFLEALVRAMSPSTEAEGGVDNSESVSTRQGAAAQVDALLKRPHDNTSTSHSTSKAIPTMGVSPSFPAVAAS
ncbi:hypothetical protein AaE_002049 [Aphanomyces astaci]|uniref:Uncharacterized protein n=1 Tax=Aphanomyces astaci TaxID=112090 RepID=A0A6A5AXE7_APHAT|nr:hypothetical protein AaE_002049 [Aphanomyces astaci]